MTAEGHALLFEQALGLLADFAVHAGQHAVEELDHGHLRAEPPPHRAELEADDAGADHQQTLGHLRSASAPVEETMRFSSISMPRSRATSEPVAMTMALVSSVCVLPSSPLTSTLPGAAMRPAPMKGVDLVLLQQKLDALDVAVDALSLNAIIAADRAWAWRRRCPSCRTCGRPPRTVRRRAAAPSTGCSRC